MEKEHCAFCGFELTDDDLRFKSPLDMWSHCKEHSNHATYPQLWLLKKELNMPYEEPTAQEKICAVCGMPLSEEEMNIVKKELINFTCRFHRRAMSNFNLQMTRRKLGYPEVLGTRPLDLIIKEWKL